MGKYIIELERGETAYKTVDLNGTPLIQLPDPLPYTEPDTEQVREEAYEDGYKTAKVQCNIQAEKDLREVGKRHYQKGLSDAWDAVKKLALMDTDTSESITGYFGLHNIMHNLTASEAIEKIRQYEQENEGLGIQGYFKRGDEVIDADGTKAVILRVSEDNYCQVYTKNGCIYNWHIHTYKFHKTGRNFPEIAEVLKKMQEG